jgi:hypothetical protein
MPAEEGQRRGAEFIAHGLSRRHIIHIGISEDEEREYIGTSIAAVARATGVRPSAGPPPISGRRRAPHTCCRWDRHDAGVTHQC